MGQQQLLLLVLSTVIVGLATVAGIQAFEQGSAQANQDALTNTSVKIGSDIQARIEEPAQFGGYDGIITDATGNITLQEIGYDTNSGEYATADGDCGITTGGGNNASGITQVSSASGDIIVTCESDESRVSTGITGVAADSIQSYQEMK